MSKSSSNNDKSPKRKSSRPSKHKPAAAKPAGKPAKKKLAAPAIKKSPKKPATASALVGLGLDNTDGHKRITTGEQFVIAGGSEQTHDRMTETVIKTFEALKQRGKHLSQVERAELAEIIHKSTPR